MKTRSKAIYIFLIVLASAFSAQSQTADSTKKKLNTSFNFVSRHLFMSTINEGTAKDDYAFGGGVGVGTQMNYGKFTFQFSSFFLSNYYSTKLDVKDATSNQYNRYEMGLFDVTHPSSKGYGRIEDLNLTYKSKGFSALIGRTNLNTPFINSQDGRIRPNYEQGLVLEYKQNKYLTYQIIGLTTFLPRSTSGIYSTQQSIGLYPAGLDIFGKTSAYAGNTHTKGVAIEHINLTRKHLVIDGWNYYIDNLMNTAFLQTEWTFWSGKQNTNYLKLGGQLTYQTKLGNGGNDDIKLAYYQQKGTQVYSGRLEWKKGLFITNFNYTHIGSDGRFLFPREWGRDPFYTFMPREREEGSRDLNAYSLNVTHSNTNKNWSQSFGAGYYNMPNASATDWNKYKMPDYLQVNLGLKYSFTNRLKGLDLFFLVAAKANIDKEFTSAAYTYNKTNLVTSTVGINVKL